MYIYIDLVVLWKWYQGKQCTDIHTNQSSSAICTIYSEEGEPVTDDSHNIW